MSALVHCLELCCAGKEFIDTSIKTQPSQRVDTTSSLSSSPVATTSGSTIVSVKHGKTSSCVLPTHAEVELPPTEESKPLPALSSDSLRRSADVPPLIGGCEQKEEKDPEPASCTNARGAGATRLHPSAAVTSEEKTDDEVEDEEDEEEEDEEEEEEEDQEEEEDNGDMAEDVEEIEGGTKPKKGSRKKAAAKRKSITTDRAGKRSRAVEGSKSRAGKVEGAPKQSPVLVNAGKRKKTPVLERTSKASNTRAGKAQGSK